MNIFVNTVHRQTPCARLAQGGGPSIIIGLDGIRSEAGPRWERLRDTIYARLEALLRLRLAPTDFFLPLDETTYLVSMPKSTPDEAQVCCLRIAFELHTSLLGPCSILQLQIANAFAAAEDQLAIKPIVSENLVRLADRAQILDLLVTKPGEEPLPSSGATGQAASHAPAALRYEFMPIWDVNREVVWAYRCVQHGALSMLTADAASTPLRDTIRRALGILRRAAVSLEEHLSLGERFLIDLPVSYGTLASPIARMEFVSGCRQLPGNLRPYLVFEIADMPVGVPHSRLVDLVGSLQPFGRGVVAQIPLNATHQSLYEGTGLVGLGFALPQTGTPALEIERLGILGKRLNMNTFVENVTTAEALQAAIKAGVHWLSGPAVAAAVEEPRPMTRLRKDDVLRNAEAQTPPGTARQCR